MGLRTIRIDGDPLLRKVSREVNEVNERIVSLLDDMVETMYNANGIGLAAPQVGVLRRVIVVDVGDGIYKMINPEILESEGSDIDIEGCLSILNFNGTVERPTKIKVKYMDENGKENIIVAQDLFARCICHEIDHLNGVLFKDIFIEEIEQSRLRRQEDEN